MTTPAYDAAPLPDPDDLGQAVEQVEAALVHLEDVVLARVTRQALTEGGEPVPAEQVWAEFGLCSR
jgi:hypothetical protein